jgi:hypothetical protein
MQAAAQLLPDTSLSRSFDHDCVDSLPLPLPLDFKTKCLLEEAMALDNEVMDDLVPPIELELRMAGVLR